MVLISGLFQSPSAPAPDTSFSSKGSVRVATTGALSATYANGSSGIGATLTNNSTQLALVIDGVTMAAGDRVLVKNQGTTANNGIYTVTNIGGISSNWILTRATDYDETAEVFEGTFVIVEEGTVGSGTMFIMTATGAITIGTTGITFVGLTVSNYSGSSAITTVGTVTAGTWNATAIGGQYGGTGVANTGKTITLGASLTTSGAGVTTLAFGASTQTYTFPTATDTIVGAASTNTLTNKTFDTAGSGNSFKINGTAISAINGSGSVVLTTSPTLITPILGVASATSLAVTGSSAPANGVYLPAANTLGLASNSAAGWQMDSNNRIQINYTAAVATDTQTPRWGVFGANGNDANIGVYRYSASSAAPYFCFSKARGSSIGSMTVVNANDTLGIVSFNGSDGTNFVSSAQLLGEAEGSISTGIVPGRLRFLTANASGSKTEAGRIDSTQNWVVGTAAIATGATAGFLWITSSAGAPTGAATAPYTNAAAIHADTTNSKLWVRFGSSWKGVVLS